MKMANPIKIICTACFVNLLIFNSLALGGEIGNHSTEMKMAQITGTLTGAGNHTSKGTVSIIEGKDGKAYLRISNATIDRVPDGRIYLAKNADHTKGIELGKLHQFSGDLQFAIPSGVDVNSYDSVVIWCKRFSIEIGHGYFE